MKRLIQMTIFAVLASLAVGTGGSQAVQPTSNPCGSCEVESGRYFEHEPVGPNNISNVRGVRAKMVRTAAGGVPSNVHAKAYVSVTFENGSWVEYGVERSPTSSIGFYNCVNTPDSSTGDAYPTSRIYARWKWAFGGNNAEFGCLYGQEVINNEDHQFRLQRCGTGSDWCTYLDGSFQWNLAGWGGGGLPEQGDEVRIGTEFDCQGFDTVCHDSDSTWAYRFGGALNWGVTNASTAASSQPWYVEHFVAGEAAKANTPAGYWTIENISTSNPWDIYHIFA